MMLANAKCEKQFDHKKFSLVVVNLTLLMIMCEKNCQKKYIQ